MNNFLKLTVFSAFMATTAFGSSPSDAPNNNAWGSSPSQASIDDAWPLSTDSDEQGAFPGVSNKAPPLEIPNGDKPLVALASPSTVSLGISASNVNRPFEVSDDEHQAEPDSPRTGSVDSKNPRNVPNPINPPLPGASTVNEEAAVIYTKEMFEHPYLDAAINTICCLFGTTTVGALVYFSGTWEYVDF